MSKDTGFNRLWGGIDPTRDKAELPRQEAEEDRDPRAYQAFDIRDRAEVMSIYSATGPCRNPAYSYLLDVVYEHHFQSAFQLLYSFMGIEVKGENLGRIVHAINYRQCACIRQYHKELFDHPPAKGEPVIHSITLLAARDDRRGELEEPKPRRA
jgi:hypothetical protein